MSVKWQYVPAWLVSTAQVFTIILLSAGVLAGRVCSAADLNLSTCVYWHRAEQDWPMVTTAIPRVNYNYISHWHSAHCPDSMTYCRLDSQDYQSEQVKWPLVIWWSLLLVTVATLNLESLMWVCVWYMWLFKLNSYINMITATSIIVTYQWIVSEVKV